MTSLLDFEYIAPPSVFILSPSPNLVPGIRKVRHVQTRPRATGCISPFEIVPKSLDLPQVSDIQRTGIRASATAYQRYWLVVSKFSEALTPCNNLVCSTPTPLIGSLNHDTFAQLEDDEDTALTSWSNWLLNSM